MTFNKILFPVDFSERTVATAPYVRAMAQRFGAEILLVHVPQYPMTYYGTPEGVYFAKDDMERVVLEARQFLRSFQGDAFPGMDVRQIIEEGEAGAAIAEVANRERADLIMIPTHGRGLFRTALLGSVTSKVLHDAHCPVWTNVHKPDHTKPGDYGWHHMMCAVSSDVATRAETVALIHAADQLAKDAGAKLWLVHAVPVNDGFPSRYLDTEFTVFLEKAVRDYINGLQNDAGTNRPVCIGAGRVAEVVRNTCAEHNADVLVIGRGVLNEFGGRLRTHEYSIIREAPCPVLSV